MEARPNTIAFITSAILCLTVGLLGGILIVAFQSWVPLLVSALVIPILGITYARRARGRAALGSFYATSGIIGLAIGSGGGLWYSQPKLFLWLINGSPPM